MNSCPHCNAPGQIDNSSDDRCTVCGMSLLTEVEPSDDAEMDSAALEAQLTARMEAGTHAPPPLAASEAATLAFAGAGDSDGEMTPHGQDLIRPRNLSPAYQQRVAAAAEQTSHPFRNPQETIKSGTTGVVDYGTLHIGSRVLGQVSDAGSKDYELTEVIGEGAMGTVWSARQTSLDRQVAVKMPKSASQSEAGQRQFMSEVVVTGQLDHPNIVPIYELARNDAGQLFYAMKRVEGRPWSDLLKENAHTEDENLEILLKVCDAIRFAHDRGVIHRDIKPHNIMIGRYGEVSVMDWGIAMRIDVEGTGSGIQKINPAGTPAYMAPEMATGSLAEIGPATDVYLLGAVLYQILSGDPPHPPPYDSGSDLQNCANALVIAARNEIPPLESPSELVEVAYRALATDVENRYQSVQGFQDAIREHLSHVESIKLTDRGSKLLAKARVNGHPAKTEEGTRFDDFDRARFAFGEALQIWPGNKVAQLKLGETVTNYAQYAYDEGAYARGIALLSETEPSHRPLLNKLKAAKRRTKNAAFLLRGALAALFIGGAVFSTFLYLAWSDANLQRQVADRNAKDASRSAELAEKNEKSAIENEKKALEQEKIANENAKRAREQENIAIENAKIALEQEKIAKRNAAKALEQESLAKQNAERATENARAAEVASYASEIGLAAEELRRNSFDRVAEILDSQAKSASKSPLRNWEWRYLNGLTESGSASLDDGGEPIHGRIESVTSSPDGNWIAAGTDVGDVYVWNLGRSPRPLRIAYGDHVYAVAISPDGSKLYAAGRSNGSEHAVKVWQLPLTGGDAAATTLTTLPAAVVSLDLSSDGSNVLIGTHNGLWGLIPAIGGVAKTVPVTAQEQASTVWSVRFSPDDQWIATACEDGTVRIWSAKMAPTEDGSIREAIRFEGHEGAVYTVDFSPQGDYVVSGGRDRRLLAIPFDASLASTATYLPAKAVRNQLISTSDTAVRADHTLIGEHDAAIRSVSYASDGTTLFSGGNDNTVRVWNVGAGIDQARLVKTLRGHGGWVRSCLALIDQPGKVLSGGFDRRVRLWNWNDYQFPVVLKASEGQGLGDSRLSSCATSSDAEWIATASQNGVVAVWDMIQPDAPKLQVLGEGHDWQATTGQFFDRGERLLTSGGDNTTLVWDVNRGNELVRIGGWQNESAGSGWRGVANASHNGKWIATGADGAVLARLWNATTGKLIFELATGNVNPNAGDETPEATALAFAADDSRLLVGDQMGGCSLFDSATGKLVRQFANHTGKINAARAVPNSSLIATASSDGSVKLWDVDSTNSVARAIFPHGDRVVALDIATEGRVMITGAGSDDRQAVVRVWALDNSAKPLRELELSALVAGEIPRELKDRPVIRSVALDPTGEQAAVTLYDRRNARQPYRVSVWHWDTPERVLEPFTGARDISTAIYSPTENASILTVGGRGARLKPVGQFVNSTTMLFRPQPSVAAVAFSPDGQQLVSAGGDGSLKIWKLDGNRQWKQVQKLVGGHSFAVVSVAFDPKHNDRMASVDEAGTLRLWELSNGDWSLNEAVKVEVGEATHQLAFVPADLARPELLATAGEAGVRLWNLDGTIAAKQLNDAAKTAACCLAISPDGHYLAAGQGQRVTAWNIDTGAKSPSENVSHSDEITALAFSTDGSRLFTGSRDYSVKVWTADSLLVDLVARDETTEKASPLTPRELLTLDEHTDEVTGLSVSPGGFVVSTSLDGQAIVWRSQE